MKKSLGTSCVALVCVALSGAAILPLPANASIHHSLHAHRYHSAYRGHAIGVYHTFHDNGGYYRNPADFPVEAIYYYH